MNVSAFLDDLETRVDDAIAEDVVLVESTDIPGLDAMFLERSKWLRVDDVVAVVADLKGSTKFNTGKNQKTIAKFYEAYMGQLVRAADRYGPGFIDIQGDGLFALFSGARRYERALCAGVTMKTFVELRLLPALSDLTDLPETGLKVGIASGSIFVKKVGIRGTNEPIWAGRPVNWAAKAAQTADAGQLIVIGQVFEHLKNNAYIRNSCGCSGPVADLWKEVTVDRLPEGNRLCHYLRTNWCVNCGSSFEQAILEGKTTRD